MTHTHRSLVYRDALLTDLSTIVAIYNSTVASRIVTADTVEVSIESKLPWFKSHNKRTRPLWMVENGDRQPIGWVSFQSFYGRPAYNGTAEISIYLDENQRGKGYGKEILRYALQQAPIHAIDTIMAFIFAHNLSSINLFQQEGFEEWGNFPDIALLDGVRRSLVVLGRKV
ncbi:N-acetyltransferase [Olivibacter sp. SDN3]|uniref:GNAT family N-acetyltransferase n=1 Tax=Olivibacter sp. SDN3 TaxID=2764720 RepID=UPI0016511C32|nr:GNAT family N-acetyltransferase [Olivibacter sp. SDN3]QNL51568.1 N-acetyltransferase [Olivibacter sp. SDN3]